jgi:2-oxoglutarate dehydrogenase E1 component
MENREASSQIELIGFGANAGFVDELYSQYRENPSLVSESWRAFFAGLLQPSSKEKRGTDSEDNGKSKAEAPPKAPSSALKMDENEDLQPIRGVAAKILQNMETSLSIPTAASQRIVPVKVLEENRTLINQYLSLTHNLKVSFTHIIAWAIIKALKTVPSINASLKEIEGQPYTARKRAVNIGIAADIQKKDGSRSLIVPNLKSVEIMNFRQFADAYSQLIDRIRKGTIEPPDFLGTTITLTNPGTVGTNASLPRLMVGQGAIIATGAIGYPAEYLAMNPETLSALGISKTMFVTCTYDHRIIQGAESGQFLGRVHELLVGEDGFYEEIFDSLKMPYKPVRWAQDSNPAIFGGLRNAEQVEKQARVLQLINLYRVRGHLIANLDPLWEEANYHPELDPANFGLTIWDLDRQFITGGLGGIPNATLREILSILKQTYCEKVGVEYMHIQHPEEKTWLQGRMEPTKNSAPLDKALKREIYKHLLAAEGLEKFMHKKFVGHKRFALEGAEVVIPVLGNILSDAAHDEVRECVIGMAHRGRINVLANIIKKPFTRIFSEFQGNIDPATIHGSGDVKYHLGASGTFDARFGKKISVTVVPNPSHLEAVNPVVEGVVRAKQDRLKDTKRERIIPVLIHGDAAFAGQGVVAETLNLSQLPGYRTGGTIHIIINNQIGFTTSPEEARSTPYATDVAKMVQAPIFHANGDDSEACIRVAAIAFEYRQRFKKDVVIDIVCYRRHGHNEGDEPSYTQPLMYKKIKEHPGVRTIYEQQLIRETVLTSEEAEQKRKALEKYLDECFEAIQLSRAQFEPDVPLAVSKSEVQAMQPAGTTRVELETLNKVLESLTTIPSAFKVHPKLVPQIEKRRSRFFDEKIVDWALAEAFALGTLMYEGTPVRLSGEDSSRGTFSQRHLILTDLNTGQEHNLLNSVATDSAHFQVFDSLLSEEAVVGFEFGYSVADPLTMVIWEAQFGDFVNGAQIMIDNFIAASESKWQQPCDLVLLLPHGFEGQGPEHSSGRMERFLQLCANENLQVCNCTTPAQYFHVLRRQMRDAVRKPLIIFTPKSLLRHPKAVSVPEDFTDRAFFEVLPDTGVDDPKQIDRLIFCSGKVYYDLIQHREDNDIKTASIIRVEQLYPYPFRQLSKTIRQYPRAKHTIWVQEEPENMGAWSFLRHRLAEQLPDEVELVYSGRAESSSPATGSLKVHEQEQKKLVRDAFVLKS